MNYNLVEFDVTTLPVWVGHLDISLNSGNIVINYTDVLEAASQASGGMTFGTIMIFPALFTAGMTLLDTTDSVLMVGAYGWAFLNPIRKIWYNLTITAVSVAVALLIGGIEALGLIADKLGLEGAFWNMIGNLNAGVANFGYLVVGIFLASWAVSYLLYRWQRLDQPFAERA